MAAESPSGPVVVYVATELDRVLDTIGAARRLFQVGIPLLLLLVGLLTWLLVGWALSPVEGIRSQVAEISASALDRRLPEPRVNDEIGRLARTMNEMLGRLQTSTERQRRFVTDASHELRTPLASARAQLEVALAHPETTTLESTATEVLEENRRMERLVNDLLLLARSDDERLAIPGQPVDVDELVLAEVGHLRANARVRVDISRVSGARVDGSPEGLGRVIGNLLENAERHARSTVTVALSRRGQEVELAVAVDGPGIAVADRERIFDRFTRLDDARSRDQGGAGLGAGLGTSFAVCTSCRATAKVQSPATSRRLSRETRQRRKGPTVMSTPHQEFLDVAMPCLNAVYSTARQLSKNQAAAEDLVQETYLRAFRAFSTFRGGNMRGWLVTICINVARSDARRARCRPVEVPEREAAGMASSIDVHESAVTSAKRDTVARGLAQLPEAQRTCVALVDLGGLTAQEAADLLRCPRGTVLSRVHRGHRRLAELLEHEEIHDEA